MQFKNLEDYKQLVDLIGKDVIITYRDTSGFISKLDKVYTEVAKVLGVCVRDTEINGIGFQFTCRINERTEDIHGMYIVKFIPVQDAVKNAE